MRAQAQTNSTASEKTVLAYKRHILEKSARFASAPMEDLFRVNLLAQMLDRHDALQEKGLSDFSCCSRVLYEFSDIASRMREQGFEETDGEGSAGHSRWPQLSDEEAERYIRQQDAYAHRIALGGMMCTACLIPVMLLVGLSELFMGFGEDMFALLGMAGMFGMIGTGVYTITTAKKPEQNKLVKKGRFSLGRRLRQRLETAQEAVEAKARRRKGKGIAMLAACIVPVLLGAALDSVWYTEAGAVFGVGGMFLMIGAGVYELIMADAEKKTIGRLLKAKEK